MLSSSLRLQMRQKLKNKRRQKNNLFEDYFKLPNCLSKFFIFYNNKCLIYLEFWFLSSIFNL